MNTTRPFTIMLAALVALTALATGCSTAADTSGAGGPQAESVPVPYLMGQPDDAARAELAALGLEASSTAEPSGEVAEGLVSTQTPAPGTQVPKGSTVTYVVSSGAGSVTVPDVIGMYPSEAAHALATAGLKSKDLDIHGPVDPDAGNAEIGQVYRQTPAAGEQVPLGTVIEIRSWWESS